MSTNSTRQEAYVCFPGGSQMRAQWVDDSPGFSRFVAPVDPWQNTDSLFWGELPPFGAGLVSEVRAILDKKSISLASATLRRWGWGRWLWC
jgi:hypothetical protein